MSQCNNATTASTDEPAHPAAPGSCIEMPEQHQSSCLRFIPTFGKRHCHRRRSLSTGRSLTNVMADDNASQTEKVAASETKLVNLLRLVLVMLLASVTVVVSVGVYKLTAKDERDRFEEHVETYSTRILESVQHSISERLQAISGMATSLTSHALATGQTFPMVTIPDFELRGSSLRTMAQTHAIHYMPVVHDHQREAWEAYAMERRGQIDQAFVADTQHRQRQDAALGFDTRRRQQDEPSSQNLVQNTTETILEDGTGYHTRIWSNGAITPKGDEQEDAGPYLPLWQRR